MPNAATRSRESTILVSGILDGFTSHPPSPAAFLYKNSQARPPVNQNASFTPLHFSHIRQTSAFQHKLAMPSTQSNYMSPVDPLSLSRIRSNLIRLEDTIIFSLIERAQFALNPRIYEREFFDELKAMNWKGSWLEWFLKETETFHAKARRYTRLVSLAGYPPDEYPFSTDLPEPVLPPLCYPKILHPNNINVNSSILAFYTRAIVPRITRRATQELAMVKRSAGILGDDEYEDDGNYGSAATIDVEVLQAMSKRIHYGKFVSESKFRSNPADFIPHILNPNPTALLKLITKPEVEAALLERVRRKASIYGQELNPGGEPVSNAMGAGKWKIDVEGVRDLYETWIIPLTKEVEVEYLLHRLDGLSQEEIDELMRSN
ncbi:chorismate mutase [Ceratobasidium sp. AG-Ba]|nr:chorismate mutase [Ceratobasidium sp. AG-Ba]QRW06574.1 chorismate mutase [Ceratobasidium sp. AG-Ba]